MPAKTSPGRFFLCQPLPDALPADLLEGSPAAARAAVAWVREGAERCLRGAARCAGDGAGEQGSDRAGRAGLRRANRAALTTRRHRPHGDDVARPGRPRPLAARGAGDDAFAAQAGLRPPDAGENRDGDRAGGPGLSRPRAAARSCRGLRPEPACGRRRGNGHRRANHHRPGRAGGPPPADQRRRAAERRRTVLPRLQGRLRRGGGDVSRPRVWCRSR